MRSFFKMKLKEHPHGRNAEESIQMYGYEAIRIYNLTAQIYLLSISLLADKLYG